MNSPRILFVDCEPGTVPWMAVMKYNDFNDERFAQYRDAMKNNVAVRPPREVESIITEGGFDAPVLVCQMLLIHMWHARRTA